MDNTLHCKCIQSELPGSNDLRVARHVVSPFILFIIKRLSRVSLIIHIECILAGSWAIRMSRGRERAQHSHSLTPSPPPPSLALHSLFRLDCCCRRPLGTFVALWLSCRVVRRRPSSEERGGGGTPLICRIVVQFSYLEQCELVPPILC